jgi:hypothetical protein
MRKLYAQTTSSVVMMLAPRLIADVELHRARRSPLADANVVPVSRAWLDERLLALYGYTPREAARADTPYAMQLESLLRHFEYQATRPTAPPTQASHVARLRADLGLAADRDGG